MCPRSETFLPWGGHQKPGMGSLSSWVDNCEKMVTIIISILTLWWQKKCWISEIFQGLRPNYRIIATLISLPKVLNSLWPGDTIWQQRSGSTLAQVIACWLMAPSHYLNQCWLIISMVQWHSYEGQHCPRHGSPYSIQCKCLDFQGALAAPFHVDRGRISQNEGKWAHRPLPGQGGPPIEWFFINNSFGGLS